MNTIKYKQRNEKVVKEPTIFLRIIIKGMRYFKSIGFPYEGTVVALGIEYRATMLGLLIHFLRLWLIGKKRHTATNSNCAGK